MTPSSGPQHRNPAIRPDVAIAAGTSYGRGRAAPGTADGDASGEDARVGRCAKGMTGVYVQCDNDVVESVLSYGGASHDTVSTDVRLWASSGGARPLTDITGRRRIAVLAVTSQGSLRLDQQGRHAIVHSESR